MPDELLVSHEVEPSWLDRATFPFRSHGHPLRDGALHYIDEGKGEPLVFVHGTPTWSYEYRRLISVLRTRYRCLALDHLGFGLSERPNEADYRPEAHARRFGEWLDALDLRDVTLVVHDFGGPIALPWAIANRARVKRIVMLNTWMWSFDDDKVMQRRARFAGGRLGRLLYRYLNASLRLLMPSAYGDRKRLTPAIHGQYLAVFKNRDARVRVLHTLARSLLESRAHFAALWDARAALLDLPMLLVWGLRDHAFGPSALARLRQAFPHAQVAALPSAGHWPHEEDPTAVIEAIEQFIQVDARDNAPGNAAGLPLESAVRFA